jgi:HPt (histidine-containing phosphotransfer) domain-containing protein
MAAVLDWQRALENTDGDEELLIELVGVFFDECPGMMGQIRAAIDERDAPALNRAAHSLKGSVRIFAATAATDAALELEKMGAAGDLSGAEERWTTLSQQVELLKAALVERSGPQGS